MTQRIWIASLAAALALGAVGCGTKLAPVSGTVTFDGKPVTGGSLTFAPQGEGQEPGKPAAGDIGADGKFTLGTDGPNDGAKVGKHRVSFSPPILPPANPSDPSPPSGFEDLVPMNPEVEVKAGANSLDIELVRRPTVPMP